MATLLEEMKTQTYSAVEEAQRHNAQINERYRRLQSAEADQFAEETYRETNTAAYTVRASVLAPERPAVEETPMVQQTPQVTEYVRARIESPVFTTEKFNAVQEKEAVEQMYTPTPVQMQSPIQMQAPAVAAETQYSLSHMAKMVMAAFAAVVVVMLAIIGVNSHIISQKSVELQVLETQRQELTTEYSELQRRIEIAKSEETIREYAQSQGMIQLGE